MQLKKEIHFTHEEQDYFISLPKAKETFYPSQFRQVLDLLESKGIQRVYDVEEDVKGRYLTILVDKSLAIFEGSQELPDGVILRAGKEEPYLYLPDTQTIVFYGADWLGLVNERWRQG